MTASVPFLLRFYLPLLVAVVVLVLIIASPKFLAKDPASLLKAEFDVRVIGFKIPLPIWVKKVILVRTLLLLMAGTSAAVGASTNFTRYFPAELNVDIYFDLPGIERSLSQLNQEQLKELNIPADWSAAVAEYDKNVEQSLMTSWREHAITGVPEAHELNRDLLHGRGSLTFILTRVGPLSYQVAESDGQINFDLDVPRQPQRRFRSEFHLRATSANHLRPSVWALMRTPSILIHPEFKQIISPVNPTSDAPFDHIVVGATQITLLPLPAFSNTVYLWKLPDGRLIPVAYGVYF